MKQIYHFLSGNVPGGIGLYLLLVFIIFLTLYTISRRNELFTSRHFKRWFGGTWLVLTTIYTLSWINDPPPMLYSRFSTHIVSADQESIWLAYYFRDELSRHLQPFNGPTRCLYQQRWNYLANVDCAVQPNEDCDRIIRNLPLEEIVEGEVKTVGGHSVLDLTFRNLARNRVAGEIRIEFSSGSPGEIMPRVLAWVQNYLPLHENVGTFSLADQQLVLAKDVFYRQEYRKSQQLCLLAQQHHPENEEIRKWYYYNQIRIAADLRREDQSRHPYRARKLQWEVMANEARAFLIKIVKENLRHDIDDPLLDNMVAESFLLEEYYHDGEEFLKIAYHADPLNIDVLQNLSLLHPSRFEGLPFKEENDLLARILDICPIQEQILRRYVEKLLLAGTVSQASLEEIKKRLDKALALYPTSIVALVLQGKYFQAVFDYPKALKSYLKADSLDHGKAFLQYNIGVAYFKLEDFESAERYFQKAVDLDDYLDAHLYLGVIYMNRREYQKALERFRYRVAHKTGEDDYYAAQAMKGIRECLEALEIKVPQ